MSSSGTLFRLTDAKSEQELRNLHPGFSRITEGHATVFFAPPKQEVKPASSSTTTTNTNHQHQQQNLNAQQQKAAASAKSAAADDDDATVGDISVFYNPPQVVNRDLSVCMLQTFANLRKSEHPRKGGTGDYGVTVLEALSASGLRAIRYWHEVEGIRTIVANDLDADAVECIKRNILSNEIPLVTSGDLSRAEESIRKVKSREFAQNPEEEARQKSAAISQSTGIVANRDDAIVLMQRAGWDTRLYPVGSFVDPKNGNAPLLQSVPFDVIDLDPYGTVGPFLDATMEACKEGALICATSTDSAILCGNFPETALAKYGTAPIKTEACHEMAPRIVLAALERAANRRGKYIEPLLSLHIDFYVRVFVRVYTQPAEVKLAMCKMGYQVQCANCPQYHIHPVGHVPASRIKSRPQKNSKKHGLGEGPKSKKEGGEDVVNTAAEKNNTVAEEAEEKDQNNNQQQQQQQQQKTIKSNTFPAIPDRKANPDQQALANFHTDAWSDHAPEESSRCVCCGGRLLVGGPLYCAPTQNRDFLALLLKEVERRGESELKGFNRVRGLIITAMEELPDVPMFVSLASVASELKMCCPPANEVVRSLNRLGYRISAAHCMSTAFKTDAPVKLLFSILAQHKKLFGAQGRDNTDSTENAAAMDRDVPEKFRKFIAPLESANFDELSAEEKKEFQKLATNTTKKSVPRFVPNAPFWGPRARHTGAAASKNDDDDANCCQDTSITTSGTRRERDQ